jgi:hypothetical protein
MQRPHFPHFLRNRLFLYYSTSQLIITSEFKSVTNKRRQKQLCEGEAKKTKPLTSFLKPLENKAYQTNSAVENETVSVTEDISMSGQ